MNKKNWTASRKKDAVLRLLSGESLDSVSRDLAITIAQLESWKKRALEVIESALKSQKENPLDKELNAAKRKIGELSMENELLRERSRKQGVFWSGR